MDIRLQNKLLNLQYYTALHHKLDYFITRDKRLQKEAVPGLPVYTADEFLREFL
jgi:hypothetical protein